MSSDSAQGAGLWNVFDRLFDAVIIVDRAGRLFYANQSFRTLSDVTNEAIAAREDARIYIELPSECWEPLEGAASIEEQSAQYREVGFITKNGSLGRAQVYTGAVQVDGLGGNEFFALIIRDVSIEDRIHAKYKVQVEANEHLRSECDRIAAETSFLRRMMAELPAYNDKSSMLDMVASRLKAETGCREVYFFHLASGTAHVEPIGLDRRIDGRVGEVISQLEPILRDHGGETVRSAMLEPQGQAWITFCRPRLERAMVMVVCPRHSSKPAELRPFFESLAGQLSACLDNHAYFFEAQVDPVSGLFNRRFFDSRLEIECQRSTEKHTPLSLMLLELDHLPVGKAGETMIHAVGQAIKRRIRGADFVGRVGEARFGIVLPETAPSDALLVAESLRHTISNAKAGVGLADASSGAAAPVINCGIASFSWASDSAFSFFNNAEQALAIAKPKAA